MKTCFTSLISVFAFTLVTSPSLGTGLYKWVDSFGNVTYTDSPPPDSAEAKEEVVLDEVELVDTNTDEENQQIAEQLQQWQAEAGEYGQETPEQQAEDPVMADQGEESQN